jgi:carbamoyl-phosphate synthase/aspartate carbamoyltransferase/dihydroorotase
VPGLESTLPLLLTAAAEGRLSYERIAALLSTNPRRIYSLPEQPDTWLEIDPKENYEFPDHELYTKCGWSPFTGTTIKGRIQRVVLKGKEVVRNGEVLDFAR